MLVLTRRPTDGLREIRLKNKHTRDEITIRLISIKNGSTRLGVTADSDWSILREELDEHGETTDRRPEGPHSTQG